MSFDGVGHHDWLRGVEGAEDMAYRALELCVERGLITKVQMTLHRNNVSSLRETVRHIGEMGCTAMRVNPATDMGDWVVNGQGLTLTREELYEAELAYIPHYFEDGMPIALILSGLVGLSPETPDRYEVLPYKGGDHDEDRYLLTCARNSIQLSADGYPSICELARPLRDSSLVGLVPIVSDDPSVSCTPLAEVLSGDSPFMRSLYLKESDLVQHGGACSTCPYLSACRGGCRAEAFRETGDVLGVSPGACAFFKDGWARRLIATMREVWPGATSAILDDSLFADAASDA